MDEPRIAIRTRINGVERADEVEPRLLLVDYLRDTLKLTGTHIGCDEGVCGACTVEVDGETVKSCLTFVVQVDECEITTIEGVGKNGELDAVQRAFQAEHALQCGYCTPGMVLSARALMRSQASPSREVIREQMIGNLCRCTGYQSIVAAVETAAQARKDGGHDS